MRAPVRSLIVALAVGWAGLTAPAAIAATFTVTTTTDASDVNTADGVCDADAVTPGTQCTLRAAIEQTNAQAGQDTVIVPAGTYTIQSGGVGATPPVTDDLVIEGAGAATTILRQEVAGHVVRVGSTGSLDLRAVTVRDGVLAAQGAGIRNEGTLILRGVRVVGNQAFATDGGGIYASSTATATRIFDSVVGAPGDPNVATSAGSSTPGGRGGGIAIQGGELEIRRSVIEANEANDETTSNVNGGGIWIDFPNQPVTISETTIRGNKANEGNGGGLSYVDAGVPAASLLIERSAVTGNTADTCGGGLNIAGSAMTVIDSTISGNNAGNNGGAICGNDALTLTRSTVAANTVTTEFAPGLRWFSGTLTVSATILDNQNDDNCSAAGGSIVSGGAALDSGATCTSFSAAEKNIDPLLAALGDNGGPTATHALAVTSPAVDAAGACGGTDQRGAPRGGVCDIGAYELTYCLGVIVNRVGTSSGDAIVGTDGPDGVLAGAGDDTISSGSGNDAICGEAGNDTIDGGPGSDRFGGGPGIDTGDYAARTQDLSLSLDGVANDGADGEGDDLDVENVVGGSGDDTFIGEPGVDNALGGGPGTDTASYAGHPAAITADLAAGTVQGGSTDTLTGVEDVIGTPFADVLRGDGLTNKLDGLAGNDDLIGRGGNDALLGKAGRDLLKAGGGKDALKAGGGADRLRGQGGPDVLLGQGGKDDLRGQGGNDRLGGGGGTDRCDGGPGKRDRAGRSCETILGVP